MDHFDEEKPCEESAPPSTHCISNSLETVSSTSCEKGNESGNYEFCSCSKDDEYWQCPEVDDLAWFNSTTPSFDHSDSNELVTVSSSSSVNSCKSGNPEYCNNPTFAFDENYHQCLEVDDAALFDVAYYELLDQLNV